MKYNIWNLPNDFWELRDVLIELDPDTEDPKERKLIDIIIKRLVEWKD